MNQNNRSPNGTKGRNRMGEYLVKAGFIDEKTLSKALEIQKAQKKRLGQVLMDMGVVDDEEIAKALANQFGVPLLRLEEMEIPQEIISLVPADLVENYLFIPVRESNRRLLVAMVDPSDINAIDDIRFVTRMPIDVAAASQRDIVEAIGRYYPKRDMELGLHSGPTIDKGIQVIPRVEKDDKDVEDLMKLTERPPVVRFTNAIIADAINLKSSDIHILLHNLLDKRQANVQQKVSSASMRKGEKPRSIVGPSQHPLFPTLMKMSLAPGFCLVRLLRPFSIHNCQ